MADRGRHTWQTRETTELFEAIRTLKSRAELESFLRDLCTLSELEAMAHRWEVARLVDQGLPYLEIAERTGASTATVTRVAHWLHHGEGGYRLALDVRDGQVRTAGWTEASGLTVDEAARRCAAAGIIRVLCTAINRDGTLAGPDLELVRKVAATGLRVLAAGGVRSPDDIAALASAGAEAAVVGRALLGAKAQRFRERPGGRGGETDG